MITIENLVKSYANIEVLHIDTLTIKSGQRFGLVGNNGAGKSTLFRLLLNLIKADGGEVRINEKEVKAQKSVKISSFLDENFLIPFLTPEEYFVFVGMAYGLSKTECLQRAEGFASFFNGEVLKKGTYIRDLSKGNQKKVGLVACFIVQPELIVLDEPFANLDPSSQNGLMQILKGLSDNHGTTMLLSSHDLNHIGNLCTHIAVLEKGKLVQEMHSEEAIKTHLQSYFSAN